MSPPCSHQDQQNKVNQVCSKFAPAHTELCSIPQVRSAGSFKCLALNSMICTVCARLEVAFIRVDPTVPQKLQNMMQSIFESCLKHKLFHRMHFHSPLDSLHMQENSKDRISIAWFKNDPRIYGWWLPQWSSRLPHVSNIYSMYRSHPFEVSGSLQIRKDWQRIGSRRISSRRARSHGEAIFRKFS